MITNLATPIFCDGSNTPARAVGGAYGRLALGARVFAPIENVWRSLMNMLMSLENKVGKIRDIYLKSL